MSSIYQDKWDCFALHTWLILSSFGIMYAILSFIDELYQFNKKIYWLKGLFAIIFGLIFYILIGLRHLEGAKKR
jgi:hypothetical protein